MTDHNYYEINEIRKLANDTHAGLTIAIDNIINNAKKHYYFYTIMDYSSALLFAKKP